MNQPVASDVPARSTEYSTVPAITMMGSNLTSNKEHNNINNDNKHTINYNEISDLVQIGSGNFGSILITLLRVLIFISCLQSYLSRFLGSS